MRVLIFGGTGEARALADRLVRAGHHVTTSLAGRTVNPKMPEGEVRMGGFGDAAGLRAYLQAEGFTHIVDATHPFAEKMSATVSEVCAELGLPLIRLCRPAWEKPQGADWHEFDTIADAYRFVPDDATVFDTTGHRTLAMDAPCRRVIRLIDPPQQAPSPRDMIVLDRPPYTVADEIALMREHAITHLLTKNAGGDQTRAKVDAAVQLGIPVLVINRPALPPIAREVETVDAALAALQEAASP